MLERRVMSTMKGIFLNYMQCASRYDDIHMNDKNLNNKLVLITGGGESSASHLFHVVKITCLQYILVPYNANFEAI